MKRNLQQLDFRQWKVGIIYFEHWIRILSDESEILQIFFFSHYDFAYVKNLYVQYTYTCMYAVVSCIEIWKSQRMKSKNVILSRTH